MFIFFLNTNIWHCYNKYCYEHWGNPSTLSSVGWARGCSGGRCSGRSSTPWWSHWGARRASWTPRPGRSWMWWKQGYPWTLACSGYYQICQAQLSISWNYKQISILLQISSGLCLQYNLLLEYNQTKVWVHHGIGIINLYPPMSESDFFLCFLLNYKFKSLRQCNQLFIGFQYKSKEALRNKMPPPPKYADVILERSLTKSQNSQK